MLTFADSQAVTDSIHGTDVAVRGEAGQAVFFCPLAPHMVWGSEGNTPLATDLRVSNNSKKGKDKSTS